VLALLGPALLIGVAVALAIHRWPALDPASARASSRAAHEMEHELEQHRGLTRFVGERLDPRVATGLLLTLALVFMVLGGVVVAVLGLVVRSNNALVDLDRSVAPWGAQHSDAFTHDIVHFVTDFGGPFLTPIIVIVAVIELIRRPNVWLIVFVAAVAVGQSILSSSIKDLVERVRPAIDPIASTLGPSFPSGHTTSAAACYAALALIAGRGRSRTTQAVLVGGAVFIAVAVGASRVLLGVHWLTDVIGGFALGWGWFALCSIAFGGRLLRFGLPVAAAERTASTADERGAP
jgi:undecaprenyl-diphosphatase